MVQISNVSFSTVKTALSNFGSTVKGMVSPYISHKKSSSGNSDEFERSSSDPLPEENRRKAAVDKFNAANEHRYNAEINLSAEFDNVYEKLLPEYTAYKNPELDDLMFTPISKDTLSAKYKGKNVEIKYKVLENGNKEQEINFDDDSQVKYVLFSKGSKMEINGAEFEMPEGTIVETKSVKGRVFSKLIQTPDMKRRVINKPQYIDKAEVKLTTYTPIKSSEDIPTPKYILDILGNANSAIPLLYLSKNPNNLRTPTDEINYLEKKIAEGKLPSNISITGIKEDGGKILTIQKDNCKYEICGSEMRVIDDNGDTKMLARYESGRESNGLWIVSYDNGKPIKGLHYASWNLDKPQSIAIYTYNNDNTVSTTTTDINGTKKTINQTLPKDFCIDIDRELKFVSSDKSHLGLAFKNQKSFINS